MVLKTIESNYGFIREPRDICDGYVDIIRVKTIQKYKKLYAGKIFAYHREIKFCDIDTEEDWEYAEYLIGKKV